MNRNFIAGSILILSLALRLAYVAVADGGRFRREQVCSDDAQQYVALSESLEAGRGFALNGEPTSWRSPLYPSILTGVRRFLPRPFLATRVVQCFLGAALVLVALLLASRLGGPLAGVLAAAGCAVTYELINLNAYLVTETVFTLLHSLCILCLVLYRQTARRRWVIYGGFAMGLAILTRAQPLLFPLLALAWFGLPASVGERSGRGHLRRGALFVVVSYLVVLPWTARNAIVHRAFVPVTTELGKLVYQANCPSATGGTGGWYKRTVDWTAPPASASESEFVRSRRMLREGLRYAFTHPARTLGRIPRKFWNMWRPWTSGASAGSTIVASTQYVLLVCLYAWGLWRRRREWRAFAILHLPVVYSIALHTIVSSTVRYRYPLLPLMIVVAACGICRDAPGEPHLLSERHTL